VKQLLLLQLLALLATACGPAPSFTRVQEEIFELNCSTASCHGGSNPSAGMKLDADDSHDVLVDQDAGANNPGWKLVVAGDPEASLLYNVIRGEVGDQRQMPPGLELDEEKLELVFDWITAGALDD